MSACELGLYYLQSRYYNPQIGRFLNADALVSTGQGILGNNMFAYCENNPVTRKDSTGTAYVFLDECLIEVDPDGRYDEGGGGGGLGLGINPSYYTSQKVQAYDWNWQNSSYNQNTVFTFSASGHAVHIYQNNPNATGQNHHPISHKIERAASTNPNLKDYVTRKGWGTIRASTPADHVGYQLWHRQFDNQTLEWLAWHPNGTLDEFISFMNNLYSSIEGTSRFGIVEFR